MHATESSGCRKDSLESDPECALVPFPGAVFAERFELVRELGRGGMGRVWLARHLQLDAECAIKFIEPQNPALHDELVARFELEAKVAARIRSQHVVQILDYGTWQGTPYIAMEYLHGEDLELRLRRHRRLSPAQTFRIAQQVGRALTRAHAAGIIHRDLKPENLFLVSEDGGELVKVLDFGIARIDYPSSNIRHTQARALLGTPGYMSPEQARGLRNLDGRADLWSLAVIVYECLVGRPPFAGDTLPDLFDQLLDRPLPVPSEIAPDLPKGFDDFWARAAARDRNERYATAKDFVEALAVALEMPLAGEHEGSSTVLSGFRPPPQPQESPVLTLGAAELPPSNHTHTLASVSQGRPLRRRALGMVVAWSVAGLCIALLGSRATSGSNEQYRHAATIGAAHGPATERVTTTSSNHTTIATASSQRVVPPAIRASDGEDVAPVDSVVTPPPMAPGRIDPPSLDDVQKTPGEATEANAVVAAPTPLATTAAARRRPSTTPRAARVSPSSSEHIAVPPAVTPSPTTTTNAPRPGRAVVDDPLRSGADLGI